MIAKPPFIGFSKESVVFYEKLATNNNKPWFDENKEHFEKHVMAPARDFVYHMGNLLKTISPKIHADPRINQSIFRPYRDTRFSKDKSPYKTHLGIFFWEGQRSKMECSGYYFHLEPPKLMLAAGIHCFSPALLKTYRESLTDPGMAKKLVKAVKAIAGSQEVSIGGKHYKKTPRGYSADGDAAELLLHNGLYAMTEQDIPPEFSSAVILDHCFDRFKQMTPLHNWLVEMTTLVQ